MYDTLRCNFGRIDIHSTNDSSLYKFSFIRVVATFASTSAWLIQHPYLLQDEECLTTVLEVIELGISGLKSVGKPVKIRIDYINWPNMVFQQANTIKHYRVRML